MDDIYRFMEFAICCSKIPTIPNTLGHGAIARVQFQPNKWAVPGRLGSPRVSHASYEMSGALYHTGPSITSGWTPILGSPIIIRFPRYVPERFRACVTRVIKGSTSMGIRMRLGSPRIKRL